MVDEVRGETSVSYAPFDLPLARLQPDAPLCQAGERAVLGAFGDGFHCAGLRAVDAVADALPPCAGLHGHYATLDDATISTPDANDEGGFEEPSDLARHDQTPGFRRIGHDRKTPARAESGRRAGSRWRAPPEIDRESLRGGAHPVAHVFETMRTAPCLDQKSPRSRRQLDRHAPPGLVSNEGPGTRHFDSDSGGTTLEHSWSVREKDPKLAQCRARKVDDDSHRRRAALDAHVSGDQARSAASHVDFDVCGEACAYANSDNREHQSSQHRLPRYSAGATYDSGDARGSHHAFGACNERRAPMSRASLHEHPSELLQALIRFDTSNPPGNEAACIGFIETLLSEAGLETRVMARRADRPNLIARLRGGGRASPILLHGHVDVVPTVGQEWRYPPFAGTIADGFVWGRGALDMKGGVAMLLAALLRFQAEGLSPPGDVILAVLSDEEAGGDFGARFLVEKHPEQFAGVRHAIGEFGGFRLDVAGRRLYPIQVAEKEICSMRATLRGPGGHGALPMRGGAMARLAGLLRRLDNRRLPFT